MIDQEYMHPSPLTKPSLDGTNKDIVSNKSGLLNIDHDLNYEIQKEVLQSPRARKNVKTILKEKSGIIQPKKKRMFSETTVLAYEKSLKDKLNTVS